MMPSFVSKYFIFPIKGWLKSRKLDFVEFFTIFQNILELNNNILDLMTDMSDRIERKDEEIDLDYIYMSCFRVADFVYELIENLNKIAPYKYYELYGVFERIYSRIKDELDENIVIPESDHIVFYSEITKDLIDVVGAKNANLAEVKRSLRLNIPEGFAITTRAFKEYLDYNHLWEEIREICKKWEEEWLSSHEASTKIHELILRGELPPQLIKKIKKGIRKLRSLLNRNDLFFAIRSSAWGEDSEQHTFAGQYLSLLNRPSEDIFDAYKEVLSSVYSARAMEYRRLKGYREHEVAMAVACQVLIDSDVSGIMYTLDPQNPEDDNMTISSTWGLGAPLASGYASADQFVVSRKSPYKIEEMTIVDKKEKLIPRKEGGTKIVSVEDDYRKVASLNSDQLVELVKIGLKIENHFKKPQDIEFTYDKEGKLYILQTRTLIIDINSKIQDNIDDFVKGKKILLSGKGHIAQRGIAHGKVFILRDERDMEYFPKGAVLVAENALPDLAKIIKWASAVITDIGSPIGHMATIAREFRVPTIVNTGVATQVLKNGQEVTVDAEGNVIYEGKIEGFAFYSLKKEPIESEYPNRLLKRVLKYIVPLNLVNPMDKSFSPKNCKTFHDITRFIHEKAVEEIINISLYVQSSKYMARKLDLPIPIDLVIVDIGGGISSDLDDKAKKIMPEHIRSIPMRAFVDGISMPGIWSTEPVPVDFGSFMSSLTRTFAAPLATPEYVGQNLAVVSENYVNINLRLGYHFNLIDSYISDNVNANYIYFRFVGGATDISRRSRRARLIGDILEKEGFSTELKGDFVVARTGRLGVDEMKEKLKIVGMLVGFTRQLDVQMVSDGQVNKFVDMFDNMIGNKVDESINSKG